MRESGEKCNFAINTFSSPSRPIVKIPSRIKLAAVFAPGLRRVLSVLFSRRGETRASAAELFRLNLIPEQRGWQDHNFLASDSGFIWCRDKTHIMIPSVIEWKTAQLSHKVGSNENLYWIAVLDFIENCDDMNWAGQGLMTPWSSLVISSFSWQSVSTSAVARDHGAVPRQRVINPAPDSSLLRQIPRTGSWSAVISFPAYLSPQSLTTQWPISQLASDSGTKSIVFHFPVWSQDSADTLHSRQLDKCTHKSQEFSELNYTDLRWVCAVRYQQTVTKDFLQPIRGLRLMLQTSREPDADRRARGRDRDQVPETEKVWQTVFTAWTITNWIFMKFTQMKSLIGVKRWYLTEVRELYLVRSRNVNRAI